MRTLRLFFQTCFQGKGYMKTYWLKGKKDLSFKTPAELRYSSEQKDSEDKSSNGWVDNRRAVGTTESLFLGTDWTLDAPPLIQAELCSLPPAAPDSRRAERLFVWFSLFEGVVLTTETKISLRWVSAGLRLLRHSGKTRRGETKQETQQVHRFSLKLWDVFLIKCAIDTFGCLSSLHVCDIFYRYRY